MWNGTAEILKARPASRKTRPKTRPSWRSPPLSAAAISCEAGAAGEAVDQRDAVEQHAGGQRAEHEIFEARFGRAQVVAVDRGDDVERQRLQLEAEIERDQVVGRDHQHHAERREQRSAPDIRTCRISPAWRMPADMTSVTTEPISVSTFMKRAKASATKAPPKASPVCRRKISTRRRRRSAPATASQVDRRGWRPRRDRRRPSAAPARRPRRSARAPASERLEERSGGHCIASLVNSPPPSCAASSEAVTVVDAARRPRRRVASKTGAG